jgi:hypothetical protein
MPKVWLTLSLRLTIVGWTRHHAHKAHYVSTSAAEEKPPLDPYRCTCAYGLFSGTFGCAIWRSVFKLLGYTHDVTHTCSMQSQNYATGVWESTGYQASMYQTSKHLPLALLSVSSLWPHWVVALHLGHIRPQQSALLLQPCPPQVPPPAA